MQPAVPGCTKAPNTLSAAEAESRAVICRLSPPLISVAIVCASSQVHPHFDAEPALIAMEVDAAIGVASLIIQVCELSVNLYSKYCDQQNQFIQPSDAELENELTELKQRANSLVKPLDLPAGSTVCVITELEEVLFSMPLE
jgi:hypothetical protein